MSLCCMCSNLTVVLPKLSAISALLLSWDVVVPKNLPLVIWISKMNLIVVRNHHLTIKCCFAETLAIGS